MYNAEVTVEMKKVEDLKYLVLTVHCVKGRFMNEVKEDTSLAGVRKEDSDWIQRNCPSGRSMSWYLV